MSETHSEFDSRRIRRTIALRRGLYRSRSYAVIAAIACLAMAAQCLFLGVHEARVANLLRTCAFAILALGSLSGFIFFVRRALRLQRELAQSHVAEPDKPPDFSQLSDGSQRARNLTEIEPEEDSASES